MAVMTASERRRAGSKTGRRSQAMNKVAQDIRLGDRIQKLDTDGTYIGTTSVAAAFVADGNIAEGAICYVSGVSGSNFKLKEAQADDPLTAEDLYFVPVATVSGATGAALTRGTLTSTLTNSGSIGSPVYLSDTAAGELDATAPTGTDVVKKVGSFISTGSNAKVHIELTTESITIHDHTDNASGGTIAIAGIVGTTNISFETYTGTAEPSIAITGNSGGSGDFTVSLSAPATLSANRTWLIPNADDTSVGKATADVLTNKTLTDPTIDDGAAGAGFTNAPHDHSDAANGGTVSTSGSTGTTATTFTFDSDASAGKIAMTVVGGGTNNTLTLSNSVTTADRTITFPDATGTVVLKDTVDTLTNKIITSPVFSGGTMTLLSAVSVTGVWTDLGEVTTTDINGGTIDGVTIGASVAPTVNDIDINGGSIDGVIIGAAVAAAADVTDLTADTLSLEDAATPTIILVSGKTNTGTITIEGKTSGSFILTTADATAEALTLAVAAQTTGAATVTIPDCAGAAQTVVLSGLANVLTGTLNLQGNVSATSGNPTFVLSGSSGVFTTPTGLNTLSGDVVVGTGNIDIGADGTAGVLDIFPGTATNSKMIIQCTDIGAAARDLTITNAAQAGARTYTIPDAGASASFVMNAGASSIAGVKTFSAAPVVLIDDANDAAVTDCLTLTHTVTGGAAANGTGVGLVFSIESDDAADEKASIDAVLTDVSTGAEECDLVFNQMISGSLVETARVAFDGVGINLNIGNAAGAGGGYTQLTLNPPTTAKGSLMLRSVDNTNDVDVVIIHAAHTNARTYTVGEAAGNRTFAMTDNATGLITRASMLQEDLAIYNVPFTEFRKAADNTLLPTASDATSMAHVVGTFGTSSPMLTSTAGAGASTSETARVSLVLPVEYVAGETVTLRVHCRSSDLAVTSSTIDAEAHESDTEGGVSAALIAASPESINSASWVNKDFTINPTALVAGDILDILLTAAINDGGGGGDGAIIQIGAVQLLLDIKG